MYAVIDKAGRAIFRVLATPHHVDQVAERRLADLAPGAVAINIQNILNAFQLLGKDDLAQLILGEGHALAQHPFGVFLKIGRYGLEQAFADSGTTATAGGGARTFLELRHGADAAVVNGLNDAAFGYAHAAAYRFAVGHLRYRAALVRHWIRKE